MRGEGFSSGCSEQGPVSKPGLLCSFGQWSELMCGPGESTGDKFGWTGKVCEACHLRDRSFALAGLAIWRPHLDTSFTRLDHKKNVKIFRYLHHGMCVFFFFPFKLLHSCSGFSLHLKKVWSKCVLSNSTWKFCLCYDPLNVLLRTLKLLAIWLNWWKGSTFFFFPLSLIPSFPNGAQILFTCYFKVLHQKNVCSVDTRAPHPPLYLCKCFLSLIRVVLSCFPCGFLPSCRRERGLKCLLSESSPSTVL